MPKQANDFIQNAVISALLKGESGTGKSIAACSKVLRPTYVFDCEDRMASVVSYYRKLDGHVDGLSYDTFSMTGGFYPVKKRLDELRQSCPFKTVDIATLTSYVDIVLKHTLSKGGTNSQGMEKGKKIAGIEVNVLEDFNAETAAIAFELIATLKELQTKGINILLEAHVLTHEYNQGGVIKIGRPLITGGKKAAAKIPGYFNETFHFHVVSDYSKTQYKVRTRSTGDDFAKTSFQQLPDEIDWTGKDLFEEIFKLLPTSVKEAARVDPSAPKVW